MGLPKKEAMLKEVDLKIVKEEHEEMESVLEGKWPMDSQNG